MNDPNQGQEEEIAAGLMNIVMFRAGQNGRNFMTAEDYRAVRLMTQIVMQLQQVPATESMTRPQTLPLHPRVNFLTRVEDEIKNQIRRMPSIHDVEDEVKDMAAKLAPENPPS
jgi:Tfp pilus assembly PilM family ATPase